MWAICVHPYGGGRFSGDNGRSALGRTVLPQRGSHRSVIDRQLQREPEWLPRADLDARSQRPGGSPGPRVGIRPEPCRVLSNPGRCSVCFHPPILVYGNLSHLSTRKCISFPVFSKLDFHVLSQPVALLVPPCSPSSVSPPVWICSRVLSSLFTAGAQLFRSSLETLLLLRQEQRIAHLVPAAAALRLLRPPKGQDFHWSRLRSPWPSMHLASLPAGEPERTGRFPVMLLAVSMGGLDIILDFVLQLQLSLCRFLEGDKLVCLLNV